MQLPLVLRNPAVALIGEQCYISLVEELQVFDAPCLKLALSKVLGIGLVAGGSMVKLPQVYKIFKSASVQGISISAYALEMLSYIVTFAYNYRNQFPFSTYGEAASLTIQDFAILLMLCVYRQRYAEAIGFGLFFLLLGQALAYPSVIGPELLAFLQALTIPILLLSRVPQIMENYRTKSTGQLSAFTIFMFALGSAARVFTTLQEVPDALILVGNTLAAVFNGILAAQMFMYWRVKEKSPLLGDDGKKLS